MKRHVLFVCLAAAVHTASATVFQNLTDRQLLDQSDAVVTGVVQDAVSRQTERGIVTDSRLVVEEALKGTLPSIITITEFGGQVGTRFEFIAGSAAYTPGERVLAFLKRRPDGSYFTTSMALGKFVFDGRNVRRESEELRSDPLRDAAAFKRFLRGEDVKYASAAIVPQRLIEPDGNAKSYALSTRDVLGVNAPIRWQGCENTSTCGYPAQDGSGIAFYVSGAFSYSTTTDIANALAAWTNDPASFIRLVNGGTSTSSAPAFDGKNVIYLNYGASAPSGSLCDGTEACTVLAGNAADHTFDGDNWHTLGDTDILVFSSTPQSDFDSIITHELGHAIGLRHSNAGLPSSTSAVMNFPVNVSVGTRLLAWDKDAVDSLYGAGPACQPPTSVAVSGGGSVASGSTPTLTAVVTGGNGTMHFQWYDGTSGDTSNAVGTDSNTFTTPPVTVPKNYWVRVSNGCGSVDSSTVVVTPQTCQKPAITVDPQSATITSGQTATLMVGASGSQPLAFSWYQGQPPDTSNPVGTNSFQFTTPPLTQTTSFWVRAANSCGSADSKAALLTVPGTCSAPSFTTQPAGMTVDAGQLTYLTAFAPDATSYQWYRGTAPDTTNPLMGVGSTAEGFVQKLYIDVLHRNATPAEISTLASAIGGGTSHADAALQLLSSDEYRTLLITSDYSAYLHRAAAPSEIAFWLPGLAAGLTDEPLAAAILSSPEYFALSGGTNTLWLNRVFNDLLGRTPNAAETASDLAALATNARAAVARDVLTSAEARTRLVQGWFHAFLRHDADSTSLSFYLGMLATLHDEQVMSAILGSDEYMNFGSMLPVGPLSETTSFWVSASNNGCAGNSLTAIVTVRECAAPSISTQPQNATVTVGNSATFSVDADGATSYQWYRGNAGDTSSPVTGATNAVFVTASLTSVGTTHFWVRASNGCGSSDSSTVTATVTCGNSNAPMISLPASQMSTNSYVVSWTGDPNVSTMYTLQEATRSDFSDATTLTISDGSTSKTFLHSAIAADTRFYYRVAAFASCFQTTPPAGPFSTPASILLTVPPPPSSNSFSLTGTPCPQSCTITQTLFIPGFAASGKTALDATDTFSVTSDKPYITISPAAGTLPPDGMNVTLNINTSGLPAGSIESTVSVTKTQAAAGEGVLGTTTTTVPVSVSLVTPVTPVPKDANAPPNTVLVPAIAHADGVNSQFQSDVRITNTASQSISYLLTYTPSGTDGTQSGKQTTITIDAGETKALDDIVKNWFGAGSLGEGGIGTLEIRPLNYAGKTGTDVSFATVAASRTYNTTSTGTFGQFIPAIPLIDFLAKSDTSKISLQQVAQSSAYRTNLGFVEGSGQPVDFVVNLLDDKNNVIATRPYSLQPFEHQQPSLASFFPNTSVSDGRIQVQVTSDTGRLTAYASVLDNVTSDPLLVFPVDPSTIAATRFVVPGVAELNNGAANFHTDMRVFNGGATATNVTLSFPANPAFQPVQQQLAAGEVWSIDNVIPTLWHDVGGGAVVATTDNNAPLVLTARTYSRRDDGGTFGQFIPGVTSSDAVGVGDRPLQVVQLEQSPAFRSNLGLVEVTGSPVTLDIAAFTPDSKVAAHTTVSLAAGQFLQLNSAFAGMGFTSAVYNGRIAVTAISGTGRVAAYGSVVDNRTQDSTYVPAE